MRKAPLVIGALFLLISITRVRDFIGVGLGGGWLSWPFALGLAAGVYVSAYGARFEKPRKWAIGALIVFIPIDAAFNLIELVRTTATAQLIAPDADFLGAGPDAIRHWMQAFAIVFGLFQTAAAALMGGLAAAFEKEPALKTRAFLPQLQKRFLLWLDELAPVQDAPKVFASSTTFPHNATGGAAQFTGIHAPKVARLCACGCGESFVGRSSKLYVDNSHRMRHVRAQQKGD